MPIRKLLKRWSVITGKPLANLCVSQKGKNMLLTSDITCSEEEMRDWKLRLCDRVDTDDWMPYHVNTKNLKAIRIYYMNVNPDSDVHEDTIQMTICGASITIVHWRGDEIIDSRAAVVDSITKPVQTGDMDMFLKYTESVGLVPKK